MLLDGIVFIDLTLWTVGRAGWCLFIFYLSSARRTTIDLLSLMLLNTFIPVLFASSCLNYDTIGSVCCLLLYYFLMMGVGFDFCWISVSSKNNCLLGYFRWGGWNIGWWYTAQCVSNCSKNYLIWWVVLSDGVACVFMLLLWLLLIGSCSVFFWRRSRIMRV